MLHADPELVHLGEVEEQELQRVADVTALALVLRAGVREQPARDLHGRPPGCGETLKCALPAPVLQRSPRGTCTAGGQALIEPLALRSDPVSGSSLRDSCMAGGQGIIILLTLYTDRVSRQQSARHQHSRQPGFF